MPYKPRVQTTEQMLEAAGMGQTVGDPLRDPLFLPAAQAEERQRIRDHIRLWREASGPFTYEYDSIQLMINGKKESHPTWQVVERMEQIAYEALTRGANVREAAALSHLDVAEVEEVAARHNIHL